MLCYCFCPYSTTTASAILTRSPAAAPLMSSTLCRAAARGASYSGSIAAAAVVVVVVVVVVAPRPQGGRATRYRYQQQHPSPFAPHPQSAGLAVYELPRSLLPFNRFARLPDLCYREECYDGRDAQRILNASARYCYDDGGRPSPARDRAMESSQ